MNRLIKPFLAVGNGFVRRALRSRLHWLFSHNVVLLEITGRRSGRVYLVPVNYKSSEHGISVMTYRRRQWWRNIEDGGELPVYLKGERVVMSPDVVTDDIDAIAAGLLRRGWVRRSMIRAKAKESVLIRLRKPSEADDESKHSRES